MILDLIRFHFEQGADILHVNVVLDIDFVFVILLNVVVFTLGGVFLGMVIMDRHDHKEKDRAFVLKAVLTAAFFIGGTVFDLIEFGYLQIGPPSLFGS